MYYIEVRSTKTGATQRLHDAYFTSENANRARRDVIVCWYLPIDIEVNVVWEGEI